MVTIVGDGTSVYSNLCSVLSVFQSTTWWLDSGANVHVCSDASIFFQLGHLRFFCDDAEWVTYFYLCCWHGRYEVNFGKIVQLNDVQHVPSKKNLVSDSFFM
jgi:hypothetical protein